MKNQRGITLIALVITIIVLLILAGVSIAMLTGDNGILTQANNAKTETAKAEAVERINLELNAVKAKIYQRTVKYSNYDPLSVFETGIVLANDIDKEISDMLHNDGVDYSASVSDGEYTWRLSGTNLIIEYKNDVKEVTTVSGQISLDINATKPFEITPASM